MQDVQAKLEKAGQAAKEAGIWGNTTVEGQAQRIQMDFGHFAFSTMKALGMTTLDLAKATKIPEYRIEAILRGEENYTVETKVRLQMALGITNLGGF